LIASQHDSADTFHNRYCTPLADKLQPTPSWPGKSAAGQAAPESCPPTLPALAFGQKDKGLYDTAMNKNPRRSAASRSTIQDVEAAGHWVDAELDTALRLHGLSIAKLSVLRHLAQAKEPLAMGQLAEILACVRSNITQLVDRLEAEGMVQRSPDPHDRRSLWVTITKAGRRRYQLGITAERVVQVKLAQGLSPREQTQLARLLAKLQRSEVGR